VYADIPLAAKGRENSLRKTTGHAQQRKHRKRR